MTFAMNQVPEAERVAFTQAFLLARLHNESITAESFFAIWPFIREQGIRETEFREQAKKQARVQNIPNRRQRRAMMKLAKRAK